MNDWFRRFADRTALATGTPWAFSLAFGVIVAWFIGGFVVGFDNTLYQLLINTGTTIVTFLMVFLIQASTNRSARAIQLKLDELIVELRWTEDDFAGIERLGDAELDRLAARIERHRKGV